MAGTASLDAALQRLDQALDKLELSVERRLAGERTISGLEEELYRIGEDRAVTGQENRRVGQRVQLRSDPLGELLEIAAGLKPWQEAVRRRGYDPDEVLAQVKADQQKFADNGVVIQIDKLALGAAAGLATSSDNPAAAASGA